MVTVIGGVFLLGQFLAGLILHFDGRYESIAHCFGFDRIISEKIGNF